MSESDDYEEQDAEVYREHMETDAHPEFFDKLAHVLTLDTDSYKHIVEVTGAVIVYQYLDTSGEVRSGVTRQMVPTWHGMEAVEALQQAALVLVQRHIKDVIAHVENNYEEGDEE